MSKFLSIASRTVRRMPFVPPSRPLVNVIDLYGVIQATGRGRGLAHARLRPAIEAAFKPADLTAVALAINSPGGSPVQSRLIHHAIRREAEKKQVPVFAFIEDVGASGGYILALAGDEIVADDSSIVGSIGVVAAGFGFVEAIGRLGVERRVHTAGRDKSQLDPFRPEDPEDVARLDETLIDLHGQFIALVTERRGDRLAAGFDDTFTGAFWTARRAKERGLIDATGRLDEFIKTRFGENARIRRASPKSSPLLRLLGGAGEQASAACALDAPASGAGLSGSPIVDARTTIDALEERALWSRFGAGG